MSDTPRLDAFLQRFVDEGGCADWAELYEFAQQLERELNAKTCHPMRKF
jgi:hypothetical protein